MLIKTPEFDAALRKDILQLAINKTDSFLELGSYKIKEFGEYVTDLDLTSFVYYTPKLLEIVSNIIIKVQKTGKFYFIQLVCGTRKEFELPWSIDNKGGCNFNLTKTERWFENFKTKNLVPTYVITYIQNKLESEFLSLRDLIDIENIIKPFGDLIWKESDIKIGYMEINNIKYNLIEIMKIDTPVLEYVYIYNNSIFSIDNGLVDKKYQRFDNKFIYFYTNDWYKIMKTYRWKINEKYRNEYLTTMNKISKLISLRHNIKIYLTLEKHNKKLAELLLRDIVKTGVTFTNNEQFEIYNIKLYEKINNALSKYVDYYYKRLQTKYLNEYLLYFKRGLEGQIKIDRKDLNERECPFFTFDSNQFEKIINLEYRFLLDHGELVKCIKYSMNNLRIPFNDLINQLGQNRYSIIQRRDKIGIIYNDKTIKVLDISKHSNLLKKLQLYFLLFREKDENKPRYDQSKLNEKYKSQLEIMNLKCKENTELVIYSDGSCMPNPGKGGWGFIAIDSCNETPFEFHISGGSPYTTNNIMEMTAVIEALKMFNFIKNFKIYTDSQYVINVAQGKWKKTKNLELWKEYDTVSKGKNINYVWVKGHSGDKYNELVDRLAKSEVK